MPAPPQTRRMRHTGQARHHGKIKLGRFSLTAAACFVGCVCAVVIMCPMHKHQTQINLLALSPICKRNSQLMRNWWRQRVVNVWRPAVRAPRRRRAPVSHSSQALAPPERQLRSASLRSARGPRSRRVVEASSPRGRSERFGLIGPQSHHSEYHPNTNNCS